MTTFYNKINSAAQARLQSVSVEFSEEPIANPLGGTDAREFVPLWLQLLPENSEELKLPEEVNDAVYSPEGETYPSIDFDPRAGFFERSDAHTSAVSERLGAMSLRRYSDYEAASLSNDEEEFLSDLDKKDASRSSESSSESSHGGEQGSSDSATS